jgi:hypothetical protein
MGLSISPDIYQEKMSAFCCDMENIICVIDDIALITNGSFENHLNQLDEILQRLKETTNKSMATSPPFAQLKLSYLTRSQTSSQKSQSNCQDHYTKNSQTVHSFIGMINYYKDYIPCCSDLLTPLTYCTYKKGARFKWTDDCQHSFDELKCLLAKQMVLAILTSLFHLKSTWMHQTNKLDQ